MMHVVIPVHPDRANQTQCLRPKGSIPGRDRSGNLTMSQKEGATILSLAKVIVGVVVRNCTDQVMGAEPFVEVTSWWHTFPFGMTFKATKDVNVKLSLESMEIMNL